MSDVPTQQSTRWQGPTHLAGGGCCCLFASLPACLPASLLPLQWFLAFLGLTMIGFGLAFYALFRQDRSFPDFANIWHSFASMFSYMVSEARRY